MSSAKKLTCDQYLLDVCAALQCNASLTTPDTCRGAATCAGGLEYGACCWLCKKLPMSNRVAEKTRICTQRAMVFCGRPRRASALQLELDAHALGRCDAWHHVS